MLDFHGLPYSCPPPFLAVRRGIGTGTKARVGASRAKVEVKQAYFLPPKEVYPASIAVELKETTGRNQTRKCPQYAMKRPFVFACSQTGMSFGLSLETIIP
jgi:hypothetical protein